MPRQARQLSQTGIYHIMLRGINKQMLFEDDEDRQKLMDYLKHFKGVCHYSLYGYCLMSNHIHLLIKEGNEPIATTMKRIGVGYATWYNRKYGRCGHLFQDRFKSEPVEDDQYLLTVLRYIHQNPLQAGAVKDMAIYKWSSYHEYVGKSELADTDLVTGMFATERERAITLLMKFMADQTSHTCLENETPAKISDQEALRIIKQYTDVKTPVELQQLEKNKRNALLRKIKEHTTISTHQIARLTGVSQSTVTRA